MELQRSLPCHLGKEQLWNHLLGIPVKGRLARGWDLYGEWMDDKSRSYYMTGKFGFTGAWRAGREPHNKFKEATAFAHEDCDMKEKWKRMVIWNCLFDCSKEELEFQQKQGKSERKRYVISRMLEAQTYTHSAERVAGQRACRELMAKRKLKKQTCKRKKRKR